MLNALLETFSCVYSETMLTIISFLQKLIKGGVGIRARGLENFSKINKRGGDDYSVLESSSGKIPGTLRASAKIAILHGRWRRKILQKILLALYEIIAKIQPALSPFP